MLFDSFFGGVSEASTPITPSATPLKEVAEPFVAEDLEAAMRGYFELYKEVEEVSERMQFGEYIEGAKNLFLGLKMAYNKYLDTFYKYFEGVTPFSPNARGVVAGDIASLSMAANKLIGEGIASKDIQSYAEGKWILACLN